MTDIVNKKTPPIREIVEKRLAKRYKSEMVFKLCSMIAIGFAVLALFILISRIVQQGWQAFWTYEYTFDLYLDPVSADPKGTKTEASIRRGNYGAILRNAFQEEFPEVQSRTELRALFNLYASINTSSLLKKVVKNPDLIGQKYQFSMPVSDHAELYLKSRSETYIEHAPKTEINMSLKGEGSYKSPVYIQISSSSFSELMDQIIEQSEDQNKWQENSDIQKLKSLKETELTKTMPSFLIKVKGGIVKLNYLAQDHATGLVLLPFGSLNKDYDKKNIMDNSKLVNQGMKERSETWSIPSGKWELIEIKKPEANRRFSDQQIIWLETFKERGMVKKVFNRYLFLNANSKEPELAGIAAAFWGSVMTIIVTMGLAIPIGVGAAVYLEEFAPKNRITDILEVNINNLAAVPSIVFGLLGAAIFINFIHLPRSTPLIGGIVLSLMTLPTIIISSRVAIKAVPLSIREAALGIGASKVQTVFGHVLPLALPGIMTGSIIGLAQAMGETAPLLMIGMVAFIADLPPFITEFSEAGNFLSGLWQSASHVSESFVSASTVMPVQVYIWSDSAERAFEQRTAAAILVLLLMVIILNLLAVYLRRKFERRW